MNLVTASLIRTATLVDLLTDDYLMDIPVLSLALTTTTKQVHIAVDVTETAKLVLEIKEIVACPATRPSCY